MITKRFIPEGWNEKTAILDKNNIEEYIKNKNTLQGIVKNCDEQYNFDFYYYGLSKSKRFGKWHKKQKQNMKEESIINNIMEYYNYSKSQSRA